MSSNHLHYGFPIRKGGAGSGDTSSLQYLCALDLSRDPTYRSRSSPKRDASLRSPYLEEADDYSVQSSMQGVELDYTTAIYTAPPALQHTLADYDSLALEPNQTSNLMSSPVPHDELTMADEDVGAYYIGKEPYWNNKRRRMVFIIILAMVAIVVLSVVLTRDQNQSSAARDGIVGGLVDGSNSATTDPPSSAPTTYLEASLAYQTLAPLVEDPSKLLDEASPQGEAFKQLVEEGLKSPFRIQQRYALMVLYKLTGGADWSYAHGWSTSAAEECYWYGVDTCRMQSDGTLGVSNLGLDMNNLSGELPAEVCLLEKIEKIVVHSNGLTGSLPACLGAMPNLVVIDVDSNQLAGDLPPGLAATQVETLKLSNNQFTGSLDALFDGFDGDAPFANLKSLHLENNLFSGSVPSALVTLGSLQELTLEGNELSGVIDATCVSTLSVFTSDCNSEVTCLCCTTCY